MARSGGYGALCRLLSFVALSAGALALAGCAGGGKVDPRYGVSASTRVVEPGQPVPKGGGVYRVGRPYVVAGRTYVPEENINYRAEGVASWYGDDFHGRLTANGEVYDMHSLSAAHPTLPLPSYVLVTLREGEAAPAPSAVRLAAAKPFLPEQKPAVAESYERSPNLPEISAQA